MDRITVRRVLERMGLSEFFTAAVTAEDGMETWSQRFLCSAIKLARPPNQCVVFTSSLAGLTAAHNCTSKVWACCLLSAFAQDLVHADLHVESEP